MNNEYTGEQVQMTPRHMKRGPNFTHNKIQIKRYFFFNLSD